MISVFLGVEIHEKVNESPFEAGSLSPVANKAGSAHPCGAIKIQQIQPASDCAMIFCSCLAGFFAPGAHDRIVRRIHSLGHILARQIRKNQFKRPLLRLVVSSLLGELLHFRCLRADLCFERGGVFTTGTQRSNLAAETISLSLERLQAGFHRAPFSVGSEQRVNDIVEGRAACRQARLYQIRLFAE